MKKKLTIIVTVPVVLDTWLKGQAKYLSKFYEVEIITSYADNINCIEEDEGVKIKIVDFNREINIFKDLKILLELFIYLLKMKPTIVYTLTPKAGLLGMLSSWMARVPFRMHNVVGLPHLEATGNRKRLLILTEKITYSFASNLYCNSFVLKNTVESLSKKSVGVIGNGSVNGVDTDFFKDTMSIKNKLLLKKELTFLNDDFVITFVGRIVNDKGINELINVFTKLTLDTKNIKLLLIGDYKNEPDSISDSTKKIINNDKNIKYLEFQNDIRKYLAITDLFVLPSYREGLPNVLIEAGSYGIPLIATNINGCNEVIEDGVNGVLVDKKSIESLYLAMKKMINDEKFYNNMKSNSRKNIIKRYDQKSFWNDLVKELEKIESNTK